MPDLEKVELEHSPTFSRNRNGDSLTHRYKILGVSDPLLTTDFWPARGDHHSVYSYLTLSDFRAEKMQDSHDIILLTETWSYERQDQPIVDGREIWRWSIATQNQNITTTPYGQIHYPTSANYGTLLNVNKDSVDGVDVLRPITTLTINKVVSFITADGIAALNAVKGAVNASTWFGYAIGEVLCNGIEVATRPDGFIDVSFEFTIAQRLPPQNVVVNGSAIVVDAGPWDFIWFDYVEKPTTSGSNTFRTRVIKSAHYAQVYPYMNFGVLGLTGPWT